MLSLLPVAQAQTSYGDSIPGLSGLGWLFTGIGVIILLVIVAIAILYAVLYYMSIYNWGTTDSASFPGGISSKKTWFWLFFLIPLIVSLVFGWIPFVNIIILFALAIYNLVIVFYYFFGIRPKTKKA